MLGSEVLQKAIHGPQQFGRCFDAAPHVGRKSNMEHATPTTLKHSKEKRNRSSRSLSSLKQSLQYCKSRSRNGAATALLKKESSPSEQPCNKNQNMRKWQIGNPDLGAPISCFTLITCSSRVLFGLRSKNAE